MLFSYHCVSQTARVSLEIDFIPRIKAYQIKGSLDFKDSLIRFIPDQPQLTKVILLPVENIRKIYTNNGLVKNRMYLKTDSSLYTFFTFKASKLVNKFNLTPSNNELQWNAFLMKRYPFIFPIIFDYHWEGHLFLEDGYVLFDPISESLKPIHLKYNDILKVRIKGYWLFFVRNVIKLKTRGGNKYKFVVHNPKDIKSKIEELIESK